MANSTPDAFAKDVPYAQEMMAILARHDPAKRYGNRWPWIQWEWPDLTLGDLYHIASHIADFNRAGHTGGDFVQSYIDTCSMYDGSDLIAYNWMLELQIIEWFGGPLYHTSPESIRIVIGGGYGMSELDSAIVWFEDGTLRVWA
jgi:hypothetical protein